MMIKAGTFWVWTEQAETARPEWFAGHPVWSDYLHAAPAEWVQQGFVREATTEGQIEISEFLDLDGLKNKNAPAYLG
ncbi:hypothetical protein [Paenibacillus chitinolyticus]|uniref:Uncharacterized protein n=2 Tax=Paenibacillus chitinolyticus TaxID=79263 RepID=A0ABT4FMF5_9BACL|nr:hypothetical protein [Paenibacillus chitinolyticus]MCY9593750.1 hypothetical protein [Paenibacillus chitinolyticus]MCY9599685.1 hypothetical protein [Paenibacillus chitinolyticus]